MPYQDIKLDPYGVVRDTDALDVEAEWTNVQNMRFNDSAAQKTGGEVLGDGTTVQPYHLQFNGDHLSPLWYYMGDGAVYKTQFDGDSLLTTGVPTSGATNYDSTLFNNVPVFNNTVDAPWTTDGIALTPLPAFPADTFCEAIRPYGAYLIALNITASGTKQENRLIWSDASDAGALPASWAIEDPSTLAGDAYLTSSKAEIIDGLTLRDLFIVYKTHSMYVMRQIPGQSVMKIDQVQVNSGLLAKNCVQEFKGKHFVVSDADIVLFDGQTVQSIADKRVRTTIFANIDVDNYENSYVVRYDRQDEMWFCYPTQGAPDGAPNKAAIWNWKDNTWTFRELNQSYHISSGLANFAVSPAWSAAVGSWENYVGAWLPISNNPTTDTLVSASTLRLGIIDDGFDSYDVPMTSSLEKHSMDLDSDKVKLVDSVIPKITADVGTEIYIRIGTQMMSDDQIFWHPEQTYTVGTDRDTHHLAKGRYISVKFRTDGAGVNWKLHGFRVKVKECGKE